MCEHIIEYVQNRLISIYVTPWEMQYTNNRINFQLTQSLTLQSEWHEALFNPLLPHICQLHCHCETRYYNHSAAMSARLKRIGLHN